MRASGLVAALVLAATLLVGVGALTTLALSSLRLATVLVVALALLYVVAASALGSRSRRWLSNPYW
ncbi:hypothetical protein [Halococcus agarilyticus]|uniref:hypothetical protein n=1 Tax=Halococcus agarilyticus TaxID=1232219 RepID=UPI000677EC70|nr:hypothetical protein [Halococcus agarilyticus]